MESIDPSGPGTLGTLVSMACLRLACSAARLSTKMAREARGESLLGPSPMNTWKRVKGEVESEIQSETRRERLLHSPVKENF